MYTRRNLVGYTSPRIVKIQTARKLQWTGHVTRIGKKGLHREFLCGLSNVHFEDQEGDGRIGLIGT
jgi:hypothetical protein